MEKIIVEKDTLWVEVRGEIFVSLKQIVNRMNKVQEIYSNDNFSDPWDKSPLESELTAKNVINTAMGETIIVFDKKDNKFKEEINV